MRFYRKGNSLREVQHATRHLIFHTGPDVSMCTGDTQHAEAHGVSPPPGPLWVALDEPLTLVKLANQPPPWTHAVQFLPTHPLPPQSRSVLPSVRTPTPPLLSLWLWSDGAGLGALGGWGRSVGSGRH